MIAQRARKFPLGKTGGLIEALRFPLYRSFYFHWFPLGKTGGLIEARCGGCDTRAIRRGFRWVKPAASLKHPMVPAGVLIVVAGFRWVKPAASLKREKAKREVEAAGKRFRWVKPAASLKHVLVCNVILSMHGVSAG